MFMRISERIAGAGLLCFALAACEDNPGGSIGKAASHIGGMADCAVGADGGWRRNCSIQRDGETLVVRHANGGFRRFLIVRDGRGLIAADGAEPVQVALVDQGQIEVSVGADRYRMPATISGAVNR